MAMLTKASAYPVPLARCAVFGIPIEVLGEIFLHCLPPKWGSLSARDAPWLLTKVCCSWRELALSMPLLWSRLPFLEPEGPPWKGSWRGGRLRLLEFYLNNSAGTALSIGFELSSSSPDRAPFIPLLIPHLSRAQHLSIRHSHETLCEMGPIVQKHFPLLRSLEIVCLCPHLHWAQWRGRSVIASQLKEAEFPWAQLTQLTTSISSSTEALALLRDCRSLKVCRLIPGHGTTEIPPALPASKTVWHPHLRTLIVEDGPFAAGLLSRLMTPALSALKFIQPSPGPRPHRFDGNSRSILSFIEDSSAKLTSLTLRYVECSPQDIIDLSILIPTVAELDFQGFNGESLQCLAIKSNSPHGVLFPCLKRLVIRSPRASKLMLSDIFYSRLYLAPNANIIENTSLLQHAELYLSTADPCNAPTYFGESYQDRPEFRKLVSQLRSIYSATVRFSKEISKQTPIVIHSINRDIFPKQGELGYCDAPFTEKVYPPAPATHPPLLPSHQQCFFQKLNAAFTALEGYHITHAAEILINGADGLIYGFSCAPKTAFLYHPTYEFHTRATRLLKQWQPILSEYEAKDKWICEYKPTICMFKLVYHRTTRM